MSLIWTFEVDWNNDGVFTEEAGRLLYVLVRRGRDYYLNSESTGFEPVKVGELRVRLDNFDGRYDPLNTSSPLFPYVRPGMRFNLKVASGGTVYTVMCGEISDIQPISGAEEVEVQGVDGLRSLRDQDITVALQTNITLASAIGQVLTAAGWSRGRSIDSALDVIPYWWVADRSVAAELQDLVDSFLGVYFVAADGSFRFAGRQRAPATAMLFDQRMVQQEISLPQPWQVVRNVIRVAARPRVLETSAEIWRLRDTPYVGPGDSLEVWAEYTAGGEAAPATNVVSPVGATDYTANTATDGSGLDLTGDFSVGMDAFGATAKLTITNSGSSGGYVTLLKLRGDALTAQDKVVFKVEDSVSSALYGKRSFDLDLNWIQNTNVARDFANFLKSLLSSPRAFPKVRIVDRPSTQFGLDLFDRVDVTITAKGISGAYDVGSIEHEWISPQVVLTKIGFEPATDTEGYWRFTTELGISSVFGY